MNQNRKAALAVAAHAASPDDCRTLLDMLGLIDQPPTKRKPGPPPVDHGHGHPATYRRGCRCTECRNVNRVKCAERRAARMRDPAAADRAGHGTASTYSNYGCRCDACRKAKTAPRRSAARRAGAAMTPGRDYVPAPKRPTAWARMAAEHAAQGLPLADIADRLCVPEATVAALLQHTHRTAA